MRGWRLHCLAGAISSFTTRRDLATNDSKCLIAKCLTETWPFAADWNATIHNHFAADWNVTIHDHFAADWNATIHDHFAATNFAEKNIWYVLRPGNINFSPWLSNRQSTENSKLLIVSGLLPTTVLLLWKIAKGSNTNTVQPTDSNGLMNTEKAGASYRWLLVYWLC